MTKKMEKLYCFICDIIRLRKTVIISIICSKCKNEDEKIFKEKESIVILKIPDLIKNI